MTFMPLSLEELRKNEAASKLIDPIEEHAAFLTAYQKFYYTDCHFGTIQPQELEQVFGISRIA
jgi:hypothetical protein